MSSKSVKIYWEFLDDLSTYQLHFDEAICGFFVDNLFYIITENNDCLQPKLCRFLPFFSLHFLSYPQSYPHYPHFLFSNYPHFIHTVIHIFPFSLQKTGYSLFFRVVLY